MPRGRSAKETRSLNHVTRAEMETIVNFNKEDKEADVFTYEPSWQKHIEQRLHIQSYDDNGFGGKSYHVPKSVIPKPRAPRSGRRIVSAEQIAKMQAGRKKHTSEV